MNRRLKAPVRIAAVVATTALVGVATSFPAAAADGDVEVTNTETIQVYTSPTGKVDSGDRRVYEQLSFTGNGTVDFENPISTEGMRNLDGFGGFDVENGKQVAEVEVDGEKRLRSVSDFKGKLPLELKIEYFLDGKRVDPGDVVGESGKLEVRYTVRNVTTEKRDVRFDDGTGGTITKSVDVAIPMVGSLTTIVPSNFTDVESGQANIAGDGRGATKLSFTMTLFPPIGSDTAKFGYTAQISDGVVPPATISALPINPLESPSFKGGAESYKGGADTGARLTAGATEIDANLLKLRDGAGELLAGLIQLRDGAQELEGGLADRAAPGAKRLADGAGRLADGTGELSAGTGELAAGAGELKAGTEKLSSGTMRLRAGAGQVADGAGQLEDGAGRLSDGAGRLADGTGAAKDGAGRLADGAGRVSAGLGALGGGAGQLNDGASQIAAGQAGLAAGLTQLYRAVDALPESVREELKTNPRYQQLLAALGAISTGVGNRSDAPDAGTLLGGVNALQFAMRFPGTNDCAVALGGGTPARCGAMDAVQLVGGQLLQGGDDLERLKPVLIGLNTLNACPGAPTGFPPPPNPPTNECQMISTLWYSQFGTGQGGQPAGAQVKVRAAGSALTKVYQGVDSQLLGQGAGLDRLRAGLSNGNPTRCAEAKGTPSPTDDCGIKEAALAVQGGVPVLVDTLTEQISKGILDGLGKPTPGCDPEATLRCAAAALADGGSDLSAGMADLVAGVQQLNAGGAALAAGAGDLASGLGRLDAGAGALTNGAGRLADGTNRLSDGASRLADGAGELDSGAGQLDDGVGRLGDGVRRLDDGAGRLDVGAGQLRDGASELSTGLDDAADGSGRLADGLGEAAGGAPKLEDGAQRLSYEGTKKLIEAGEGTAQDFGERYALIVAGSQRAQEEKMAFGAPEDAVGLTAYTYEIRGDDGERGRNVARGLGALAVLGAGGAAFALRRRFLA